MARQIGQYLLEEIIGSGGFGRVWRGKDTLTGIPIAAKEAMDTRHLNRYREEARILLTFNHPHILRCYQALVHDQIFYVVMEFIPEGTLADRIQMKGPIPYQEAISIAKDIAGALDYAHGKSVIHRDIKPSNIFLSRDGVKLGDFGIARLLEISQEASTRIGTPAYMALEHIQGKACFQSDIYSLGVLLYEMLTGKVPFEGITSETDLVERIQKRRFYPPRKLNPAIPPWLEGIVLKAMAVHTSDRYATAKEFIAALERGEIAAPSPEPPTVPYPPPSPPKPTPKPMPEPSRRQKIPLLPKLMIAVGIVLLTIGGIIWIQSLNNQDGRDKGSQTPAVSTQVPASNTQVDSNKPSRMVAVPDGLVGKKLGDAEKLLTGAGFKVERNPELQGANAEGVIKSINANAKQLDADAGKWQAKLLKPARTEERVTEPARTVTEYGQERWENKVTDTGLKRVWVPGKQITRTIPAKTETVKLLAEIELVWEEGK